MNNILNAPYLDSAEASPSDEANVHIGEFREFGELFSGDKASLDSQLTILTNNQGYATKVFRLDENGQLKKRSAANIYEGHAERVPFETWANHGLPGIGLLRLSSGTISFASACCGSPEKAWPTSATPRPVSRLPSSKSPNDRN